MDLRITICLQNYAKRQVSVAIDVWAQAKEHIFTLPVLAANQGVVVLDWRVMGAESQVRETEVHVTGKTFHIQYTVEILQEFCLGSSKDVDFLYPFINSREIFFGTGILPIPQETCSATFQLTGLPKDWAEFSSLTPGGMHADKLAGFFCYCAPNLIPDTHIYHGQKCHIRFRVLVQVGKSLSFTTQDLFGFFDSYMDWLEQSLVPYQRADEINFLVLQAPSNFATLANHRTFASGENVLNGIACYAPSDIDYLKSYFDYMSYAQYLYEGLAHELMHTYTSASPQGREKSVLYPSPECPNYIVRLLADALNIYFYSQYVSEHVPEAHDSFEKWMSRAQSLFETTGKRQPLLDLQMLDTYLSKNGSSLLALFRELVKQKLADRQPYESAEFLFETMRIQLHINPATELESYITQIA